MKLERIPNAIANPFQKIRYYFSKKRKWEEELVEDAMNKIRDYPKELRNKLEEIINDSTNDELDFYMPYFRFLKIFEAFNDADGIIVDGDLSKYFGDKEVGGWLKYNITNENGKKMIHIIPEKKVDGTKDHIKIKEPPIEGEYIGRWHYHPSGKPLMSLGDQLSFLEGVHLIVGNKESRLYIIKPYVEVSKMKDSLVEYTSKDSYNEIKNMGYPKEFARMTSLMGDHYYLSIKTSKT